MPNSAYYDGYSEEKKRQLESVPLPTKIKCKVCKEARLASAYSNRQMDAFRHAAVVHGQARAIHGGHATCTNCTAGPTRELRCCICDVKQDLSAFAKNQRHNRDTAICLACNEEVGETEPVGDENKLLTESGLSTNRLLNNMPGNTLGEGAKGPSESMYGSDVDSLSGGAKVESSGHGAVTNTTFFPPKRPGPPKKPSNFARIPSWMSEKPPAPMVVRKNEPKGGFVESDDDDDEHEDAASFL